MEQQRGGSSMEQRISFKRAVPASNPLLFSYQLTSLIRYWRHGVGIYIRFWIIEGDGRRCMFILAMQVVPGLVKYA